MSTPCYNDPRFLGNARQMRSVMDRCALCPCQQWCLELGMGEKGNVYAGTLPTDPVRQAFRKQVDKATMCTNGHPKELYGFEQEGPGHQMIESCQYCAGLQLRIMELSV